MHFLRKFRIKRLLVITLSLILVYLAWTYWSNMQFTMQEFNDMHRANQPGSQIRSRKKFFFEHASMLDRQVDPSGKIDWHDWTMIARELKRTGPGEQGKPVIESAEEREKYKELQQMSGYNAHAGDKVSLYRSLPDLRHAECKEKKYLKKLPMVSVIVPFYEEHFSSLMRTVISCLNRAPPELIKEVILVDDGSSHKAFLQKPLQDFIDGTFPPGLVRLLRKPKREGLIRTRIAGAQAAQGEVLLFLDCHVEASVNYLPPLLEPIALDYRTVTCPFIDIIDKDTMEFRIQDQGARGAFDWSLSYKRLPRLATDTKPYEPFESPVMAGGLFAISKRWFDELGQYDPEMYIWGGEQYELSFKLWMCGGRMLDVPCSRIGHIYRPAMPFKHEYTTSYPRNMKRLIEVWMDGEYKQAVYQRDPTFETADAGDLTERKAIRQRLHCKDFSWFMQHVAPDIMSKYPLREPHDALIGSIKLASSARGEPRCIGFNPANNYLHLSGDFCKTFQFHYTYLGEILHKLDKMCADRANLPLGHTVPLFDCHKGQGNQMWTVHWTSTHQWISLRDSSAHTCLQTYDNTNSSQTLELRMMNCDETNAGQRFVWGDFATFQNVTKEWRDAKVNVAFLA